MNKREIEKKKEQKKIEKQKRKENRKISSGSKSFDDMIAYVDENGVITSTPPDPSRIKEIDIENIAIATPKREEQEEIALKGRVEHFNGDKGYGFIKDISSTDKYFFHISGAPATIAVGDLVTFELEQGPKGMNAVKITIIKEEN